MAICRFQDEVKNFFVSSGFLSMSAYSSLVTYLDTNLWGRCHAEVSAMAVGWIVPFFHVGNKREKQVEKKIMVSLSNKDNTSRGHQ